MGHRNVSDPHAADVMTRYGFPATSVVRLRGEMDLVSAPEVTALLDSLTRRPGTDLVVDLRDVTFIDCAGLSPLCRARIRLLSRGGRIRLIVDSPSILRLFQLTGLQEAFRILPVPPEGVGVPGRSALDPAPDVSWAEPAHRRTTSRA